MNRPGRETNRSRTALTLIVLCVLGVGIATVPGLAGADVSEGSADSSVATESAATEPEFTLDSTSVAQSSDVVATFTATNVGDGFISFDEDNIDDARAEGLSFSEGDIIIEGEIYDNGSWQSTDTTFKTLNTESDGSGFDAQPTAPNGLEGEFDPDTGRMTASGTLKIELLLTGDTFQFDLAMVTGTSNGAASSDGLQGEFDADLDNGGFVNLVDNEYTVPEETGNDLLDQQLGLPIEEPGLAWFDLHLNLETSRVVSETGSLTGTVTDESGDPVEGATVDIVDSAKDATTGADGSYSFEELDVGTYDIRVSADQYQTTEATVDIAADEQTQRDVTLGAEPATLELSLDGSVVTAGETLEVIGTVTNTGGTTATETATISIGDLATSEQSIEVAPGESVQITETVDTTESDAGEYTAELTADGKRATTEAVVRDPFEKKQPVATFTADNAGDGLISFSSTFLEAVAEGSYFPEDEIVIEGEIYDDNTWQSTNVEIPQLQTSADQVEVEVDVPGGITGTIDRDTGVMTADAEFDISVVGRDASFQFVLDATTGESGMLTGEADFSGDSADLTLMENEFTVDQTTGDDVVDTGLELPADEPGENWFSLVLDMSIDDDPTGSVTGTVSDQNGDPIEGATVAAGGQSVETDAQGQYTLDGLAVGPQTLTVTTPGGAERTVDVEVVANEQVDQSVTFELTGSVSGTVQTNSGEAVPDAAVRIEGTTIETSTAADGSFTLADVPAGTQTLVVDPADLAAQTFDIEVAAGEQTQREITLDLTGGVSGTVFAAVGSPSEDATVALVDENEQSVAETTTDSDGQYEFTGIQPGEYGLIADGGLSGRQQTTVTVVPGETVEQDLELSQPGINVRVEDVQTTKGTTAKVSAVFENAGAASTTETATLSVGNVASTEQQIELGAGERQQISLELTPSGTGEFPIVATAGDEDAQGKLIVTGGGEIVANFRAEAVGDSYVSFNEDNEDDAVAEATEFPDANEASGQDVLWIQGVIYEDGTWRATDQNLPNLKQSGLDIGVENRSTMTGTIDPESGSMNVNADFLTTILLGNEQNPNFEFSIEAETGESNALAGDADFERETLDLDSGESYSASVSLVDNDFVVGDKTGNLLADSSLGLPSKQASNNWFKLNLDMTIREGERDVGAVEGTVTDENGDPVNNATVRAGGTETTTDPDGSYTLEGVTAGEMTVTANVLDYEESSTEVDIEEDGTATQDFQLTPGEPEYRLAVDGTSVTEGETLRVQGAIANVGTATAESSLRLTVDELSTKAEDLDLAPQDDTAITDEIQTEAGDAGEYMVVLSVDGKTTKTTVTVEEADDESSGGGSGSAATFTATSTGGFISFDEDNLDDARSEGIGFPDGSDGDPIVIDGQINPDGTWESTNIEFPTLNTEEDGSGFDAQATFPDGLEGEFDPETGTMTAEGTLDIQLDLTGDSFQFDIALTTETSNGPASDDGLDGSFENGQPVAVTLVDNEYTVDTTTDSNLLNNQLGLPLDQSGLAWLELGLDMEISAADQPSETGEVSGVVEDSSGTPVEGVTVAVEGERQRTTTDSTGRYELSVPAGTHTLTVDPQGYDGTTAEVQVETDSTTEQDLELTALDPAFEASLDAPETAPGESTTVTGTVENTGGPGSEEVTITVGDQSTTETVELGAGESTTVEFEFQADNEGEYSAAMAIGEEEQAAAANVVVEESEAGDSSGGGDGGFIATSRGGFTSFTESSESAARENTGVEYPSAEEGTPIEIGGTIDGNSWTASSENISFPAMTTEDGIEVTVRAPDGLEGTIDRESGEMTATGQLEVEVGDGNTFTFELDATTGESGALSGEANFDGDSSTATLVDNQFIVPEKTGDALVNQQLGLPTDTPGENWFELELGLEFVDSGNVDTAGDDTANDDSDDDSGSAFTTLGLVGGLAGLGLAGLFILLVLARRFIDLIDPDPDI